METHEEDSWWQKNAIALLTLLLTVLAYFYFGVIQINNLENKVKALEQYKLEANVRMDGLEAKKVDKEVFILIMNGQSEIKQAQAKTNDLLIQHILKGK